MSVVAYQCANCGGELKFDAEKGSFACEYCFSEFTQAELDAFAQQKQEKAEQEAKEQAERLSQEAQLYTCPNCGGEIITDDTTAATECYYCHSPVVLAGRLSGEFLPKRLVPFQFNRDSALRQFYQYTKKKWFLPKDFFNEQQVEKLVGVYFPYWIIDADSDVHYTATGEHTNSWTSGDTTYTKHRVYRCNRHAAVHLEDLVKTALQKSSKKLIENVQPYDEKDLIPFSMSYLSGFQAEKRDIEQSAIEQEVLADITHYNEKIIAETVTGLSNVRRESYSSTPTHIDWEYGLLPVWAMTYLYKSKTYYFAMNGQTGKICGRLPVDAKKLGIVATLASVAVLVVGMIGGYYFL